MSVVVAVTKEHLQVPGYKLVHSIRGDGGQSDSICPLKAFSVGATYFPFTVSSSSLRLGLNSEGGRAGGQAEGSQAGRRQRGQPGVGGGSGPTWRGLRGPREGTPRAGARRASTESPRAPTRKRRSSPRPPRPEAAAPGVPPRCAAGGRRAGADS